MDSGSRNVLHLLNASRPQFTPRSRFETSLLR
jgi:hypothetical protein